MWVAGGKQTTGTTCTEVTPPATDGPTQNVHAHLVFPTNWTRYKLYLNSTTDPSFTPGVWADVTAANSLPQPTSSDFPGTGFGGFAILAKTPTDTITLPTAWLGVNMTGTFNANFGTVPTATSFPGIQGQQVRDIAGGFDYICDAEDHWKRAPITWSNF
jgi:hypothetical protein